MLHNSGEITLREGGRMSVNCLTIEYRVDRSPHEPSDMRDAPNNDLPAYRGACHRARIRATRWLMRATRY